jgi:hypothetical protein
MNRTAVRALLGLVLATIAGCRRPAPPPRGYFGPTETMAAVVDRINQNSSAIPTLRAAGSFEADVVDRGKRHFVNGDITLLYRRPGDVRLVGKKDIAGQIFEAASNAEQYWLIVKADTDTMWYGELKNLDRVDPSELPIRPDVLIEVLGIDQISTNFREPPAPTMRFNNDEDVYMLNFNVALPDRWAVRKEVWYDRQTLLPRLVLLFDENGRIVVRAYLARPRAVEGSAGRVAGEYRIYFPDSGTSIRLDLDDTALTRNNAPNERSFTFPSNPGVSRQINLDEPARP